MAHGGGGGRAIISAYTPRRGVLTEDSLTKSSPASPGAQWYVAEKLHSKTEDHSSSTFD